MLLLLGYNNIEYAINGEEAINMIKNFNYNILFLDLKMPKIDGFDVAKYIYENKKNIKTIVISASILEEDKEKCKELGILYFLIKPLNINFLKNVINEIL